MLDDLLNEMIARGLASTLPEWQEKMIKQHKGTVALVASVLIQYNKLDLMLLVASSLN